MIDPEEETESKSRSTRKTVWYALTGLALVSIVLLNAGRRIVNNPGEFKTMPQAGGSVGHMTPKTKKPIQWISILGERSSGTRWLYTHIGECFNHSLGVKRYLTRYKHWFQYRNATKYPHDTLVLAQFRNPYDWFEAMHVVPHHAPSHLKLKWKEFLEREWTTPRVGMDLNLTENAKCQEDFKYNEIVSCISEPLPKSNYGAKIRYSEHQPFYELRQDGSGKPFKNIMEMRSAKIRNFLDVQNHVGIADVWTIQYEYLLLSGTSHLLEKIEEWTGVKPECEPYPPQMRRKRPLSREFARYLNKNLDWSTEGLIGYKQESV